MPTISVHDALPAGARLGEFEIRQVLGIGGFGIVYLAFDHALEREVAIKEYMPAALAGRGDGLDVRVRSSSQADTFALGLRSFINEARLLARFDHPALVKVYRFWEAHGTAYMVMPYYRGQTLLQVRRAMSGPPDETWLRRLISPLLGALESLHRENVFHRDIAPDNILLLDDEAGPAMGGPVLLDLGAARRVIGDHTQTLTAIVKPSFAPIEQYAETVQLRQGPWTDLYALAAVVHFCITGRPPVPATARAVHDELPTLRQMGASLASDFDRHFSEPFIYAVDHALAVRPQDRPDSVAAWRGELAGIVSGPAEPVPARTWSPQTVLVRHSGADEVPAGHQAIEAQSYMTTIPAAGRLNAPPAWSPATGASSPGLFSEGDPDGIAPTVPLPRASSEGGVVRTPIHDVRTWWKWGFLILLLVAVMAVWGLKRSASKGQPAAAAVAEQASPAKGGASATTGKGRSKRVDAPPDAASASKPDGGRNAVEPATVAKPRRASKGDEASSTQGANQGEVAEPLNPRKACAGKSFILLAICMKRHCVRPEYSAHPECERMRRQEEAQRANGY